MKIHIDTAGEKEKAKAKQIAQSKPAASKPSAPKKEPKPNLPKQPPKEPKSPKDVVAARKTQTSVLQARQGRELQGRSDAFREQAGVGYWPSPFL